MLTMPRTASGVESRMIFPGGRRKSSTDNFGEFSTAALWFGRNLWQEPGIPFGITDSYRWNVHRRQAAKRCDNFTAAGACVPSFRTHPITGSGVLWEIDCDADVPGFPAICKIENAAV